jgi:hypothetical protein
MIQALIEGLWNMWYSAFHKNILYFYYIILRKPRTDVYYCSLQLFYPVDQAYVFLHNSASCLNSVQKARDSRDNLRRYMRPNSVLELHTVCGSICLSLNTFCVLISLQAAICVQLFYI